MRLANVSAVVLDEFHYMNDPSRGTVWEECCILTPTRCERCFEMLGRARHDALFSMLFPSSPRSAPVTWPFPFPSHPSRSRIPS